MADGSLCHNGESFLSIRGRSNPSMVKVVSFCKGLMLGAFIEFVGVLIWIIY